MSVSDVWIHLLTLAKCKPTCGDTSEDAFLRTLQLFMKSADRTAERYAMFCG
jgi:hypothetical protein